MRLVTLLSLLAVVALVPACGGDDGPVAGEDLPITLTNAVQVLLPAESVFTLERHP